MRLLIYKYSIDSSARAESACTVRIFHQGLLYFVHLASFLFPVAALQHLSDIV